MMDGERVGRYQLIRRIAVGGMAEIYLARVDGLGGFSKYLALKLIHSKYAGNPEVIAMLIEEAKIAVQLSHANICQIFDLGRLDNVHFISMEYVDGRDLYQVLRRQAELDEMMPVDVACYLIHELLSGLDYAHRKRDGEGRPLQLVHRDISPQNVMASFAGEVKIVDFGIAKVARRFRETEAGVIKGKYYYMSPEQAWGDALDQRTDIFSTGVVFHEMLTGEMLYQEDDPLKLIDVIRKAEIDRPSDRRPGIPAELDAIVMKALAKYPNERFPSARDFQQALARFLHSYTSNHCGLNLSALMERLFLDKAPQWQEGNKTTNSLPLLSRQEYKNRSEDSLLFQLDHVAPLARARATAPPEDLRDSTDPGQELERDTQAGPAYQMGGDTVGEGHPFMAVGEAFAQGGATRVMRRHPLLIDDDVEEIEGIEEVEAEGSRNQMWEQAKGYSTPDLDAGQAPWRIDLDSKTDPLPVVRGTYKVANVDLLDHGAEEWPLGESKPLGRGALPRAEPMARAEPFQRAELLPRPAEAEYYNDNVWTEEIRKQHRLIWGSIIVAMAIMLVGGVIALLLPAGPPMGYLTVTTIPEGAQVKLDQEALAVTTPLKLYQITPDVEHTLILSKEEYLPWRRTIAVRFNEELDVTVTLAPNKGTLLVSTVPSGAQVYLGGVMKGETPIRVDDMSREGSLALEIQKKGYLTVRKDLLWGEQAVLNIFEKLEHQGKRRRK